MLVPLSETLPERLRQVPLTEKQPAAILNPFAAVEVAVPVMLSAVVLSPEVNVDVAPELKVKALFVPLIESAATDDVALNVEVAK